MKSNFLKVFLILLLSASSSFLFAQRSSMLEQKTGSLTATFAKRIKGTGDLIDTIQTSDHFYVSLSQKDGEDFIVRKVGLSGNRIWEQTLKFTVATSRFDQMSLQGITQTTDQGYVLAGATSICITNYCDIGDFREDGILVKLRADGTLSWKRKFSTNGQHIQFSSLVSRPDGGFVVTGTARNITRNALVLVRYTADGNILWSKSFADVAVGSFLQLIQTPNNSLIVVASVANDFLLVMKVNDSGTIIWKTFLKMRQGFSVSRVAPTSNNGLVLAGSGTHQFFLVRLTSGGKVTARKSYGLQVQHSADVSGLLQTSDGGFVLTGPLYIAGNSSVFISRIKSDGNVSLQSFRIADSGGTSVFPTSNGYLVFGLSLLGKSTDTVILKVDAQGSLQPGCNFSIPVAVTPVSFGDLKFNERGIRAGTNLSLGTSDIAGTSVISRHPEINLCQ
jgi:hypothetical protein